MANRALAVLIGGAACGVLDALAATIDFGMRGVPFMRLWQGVASGALGRSSFQHGAVSAALGLFFHFLIAMTAALVFNVIAKYAPTLLDHFILSGIGYGVVVYVFMNFVVIPLSALPPRTFSLSGTVKGIVVHMICVGLPITTATYWFSKK